jgi:hypothetical protein
MVPHPGDVLVVDHEASVQFSGQCRLLLRVISVSARPTYQGWGWVSGYLLDGSGVATGRREIFVRLEGLRRHESGAGRPRNEGPGESVPVAGGTRPGARRSGSARSAHRFQPDGRCIACAGDDPCAQRRAALRVFGRYGLLPRRWPGASQPGRVEHRHYSDARSVPD